MLLKFSKAYDMLDWDFILESLTDKGFGGKWIPWIKMCLCGGKSQIMIMGRLVE